MQYGHFVFRLLVTTVDKRFEVEDLYKWLIKLHRLELTLNENMG
jgi:hypothetical protein